MITILTGKYANYAVDDCGQIYDWRSGDQLPQHLSSKSHYKSVTVKPIGSDRSVTTYVHRLVAMAYVPNTTDKSFDDLQVNHIDGNKLNNSPNNLEWVTHADNIRHAYRTGLQRHERPVVVTENLNDLEFRNLKLAAEYLSVYPGSLCEALHTTGRCKGRAVRYK